MTNGKTGHNSEVFLSLRSSNLFCWLHSLQQRSQDWEVCTWDLLFLEGAGSHEQGGYYLVFIFLACGILVPWPGIEPVAPAVEAQSPNHWTAREVPRVDITINQGLWCRELRQSPSLWEKTNDWPVISTTEIVVSLQVLKLVRDWGHRTAERPKDANAAWIFFLIVVK